MEQKKYFLFLPNLKQYPKPLKKLFESNFLCSINHTCLFKHRYISTAYLTINYYACLKQKVGIVI